jgi:hypothetical protein
MPRRDVCLEEIYAHKRYMPARYMPPNGSGLLRAKPYLEILGVDGSEVNVYIHGYSTRYTVKEPVYSES